MDRGIFENLCLSCFVFILQRVVRTELELKLNESKSQIVVSCWCGCGLMHVVREEDRAVMLDERMGES